jgi:hypothetical protein
VLADQGLGYSSQDGGPPTPAQFARLGAFPFGPGNPRRATLMLAPAPRPTSIPTRITFALAAPGGIPRPLSPPPRNLRCKEFNPWALAPRRAHTMSLSLR